MCYDGVKLCVQNEVSILGSLVETIGRVYVITYRERILTLTSYNFCISTPILKLETLILHDSNL